MVGVGLAAALVAKKSKGAVNKTTDEDFIAIMAEGEGEGEGEDEDGLKKAQPPLEQGNDIDKGVTDTGVMAEESLRQQLAQKNAELAEVRMTDI